MSKYRIISEDGAWAVKLGECFPAFCLCRTCGVYCCSLWDNWATRFARHGSCRPLVRVASGHYPPHGFSPDLDPLELLATAASWIE